MAVSASERLKKFRKNQEALGRKLKHFYLTQTEDSKLKDTLAELRSEKEKEVNNE